MYAAAISVCISLALLVILYVLFRDFWVDSIRNDLFELRDEMFLYACENGLTEHPAHKIARQLMNSVIRYAHEISLFRFFLLIAVHVGMGRHKKAPPEMLAFQKALKSLSMPHEREFERFHARMLMLIGKQVVKTSLVLRTIGILLDVALWFSRGSGNAKNTMTNHMPLELLEQDALVAGAG